ncbi:hypothetical protein [Nocardioides halotolerans]|uniref:hypothetical protein n=1 Tax=Nocardioides halotolerans TaxID=433660 RepID=UPI000428C616|nr:hypothetical protein [Nocardioides halotolerans]
MKRMSRFLPSQLVSRSDADHHYEQLHHRFAMRMFREHAPSVARYATNHAVARRDLTGGFGAAPTSWRFVILEFDDAPAGDDTGGKEWLPGWAETTIVDDHTNFLREVRPFEVTPTVLVDRRGGQLSTAKFLLEVEAEDEADPAPARARLGELSAALSAAPVFGLRLVTRNDVVREAAMDPVREPGQAYAGAFLQRTTMIAFVEVYTDHPDHGAELLAGPDVAPLLRRQPGVRIAVHRVDELVGVDRG